jgi:uncharacterized protein (TIGR02597 family)
MRTLLLFAGILLAGTSLQAQSYSAPPVGFTSATCLANSDTLISLPFSRPPEFVGGITSVSGSTLTISGTTGWQDNQFVYGTALSAGGTQHNTYYALIGTNAIALAGTINLTSGSNLVTGVGTTFTTAIASGDGLVLSDSSGNYIAYYIVSSVTDNTDLVLTGNARTSLSGQTASVSKSSKEGHAYLVTANVTVSGTSTVTLDTNGDVISSIAAGTLVSLIPYWTLVTVFPPSDLGASYVGTQSVRSFQTQILVPNYQGAGINISPYPIYFYSNANSQWQMEGGSSNAGDTILQPDGYFTVRNGSTPTTLTSIGAVSMQRLAVPLTTGASPTTPQDNFVSISRPLPVALRDLNLIASNAFTPSTSIRNVQDQLFLYDNTVAEINKTPSPSADYIYLNGIWQQLGGTLGVDAGGNTIPAGAAILIRKAGTNGSSVFWTNPPTY